MSCCIRLQLRYLGYEKYRLDQEKLSQRYRRSLSWNKKCGDKPVELTIAELSSVERILRVHIVVNRLLSNIIMSRGSFGVDIIDF